MIRDPLMGGGMAALTTALGTLPVMLSHQLSQRTHDTMLGFGVGVMLAASSFSLIIPALASTKAQGAGSWGACALVDGGILAGAMLLMLVNRVVPHEHFIKGLEEPKALAMKRVWLFVLAISLHNLHDAARFRSGLNGRHPDRADRVVNQPFTRSRICRLLKDRHPDAGRAKNS